MLKESEEREARHRIEQQNMKENIMKEFEKKLPMQFVGGMYHLTITYLFHLAT
jgi:hypothetical protein